MSDGKIVAGPEPTTFEIDADDQSASSAFDREAWGSGFDSAEEAALSRYPPGEARILGTDEDTGDRVRLIVEVNRSTGYTDYETCVRHEDRWYTI